MPKERKTMNADVIVNALPEGYRWADEIETEAWSNSGDHHNDMVQVRVGGTDDEPWTDVAIRENY